MAHQDQTGGALADEHVHRDLEVDTASEETDSAFGDEAASSTTSVWSSILEGVSQNGRNYHRYKEGKYILPEDEAERDRLDLQHHMFRLTINQKLYLAPLGKNVRHALDIGCGTGLWAMEFAEDHPEAQVVGVDLSAMQPSLVPPNCKFEIDDCEDDWTFSQKFDFIHCRMMVGAFADWKKMIKQSFDASSPGGWVEIQDINFPALCDDDSFNEKQAFYKWNQLMIESAAKAGRPLTPCPSYKTWMIEAGFEDVQEVVYKWPINQWPKDRRHKELGAWMLMNVLEGLQGFSLALMTRVLGMSREEVEVFLVDVRNSIKDKSIHAYWPIYFVYGRKPDVRAETEVHAPEPEVVAPKSTEADAPAAEVPAPSTAT